MSKIICFKTLKELESSDLIQCDVKCPYYNACADDLAQQDKKESKQTTKSKKPKAEKEPDNELPPENEQANVPNIGEDGFQHSMEEDFIVEAMKLDDQDNQQPEPEPTSDKKPVNKKPANKKPVNKKPTSKKPTKSKTAKPTISWENTVL